MDPTEQREEMLEFIVQKLTDGGESVVPMRKKLLGGFISRYIKVGSDGVVLLADREYTRAGMAKLREGAKKKFEKVAVVFLKDGETYFRTAAPQAHFKADGRSLKQYTTEEVQRMMLLRPEELHCLEVDQHRTLQYYQPNSSQLEQALIDYTFQSVIFDYRHVGSERYQPRDDSSKRINQWLAKAEHRGPLALTKRDLVPAQARVSAHACADINPKYAS